MASKPKQGKTYIVIQLATGIGRPLAEGRYRVGAKNRKQAAKFLRNKIGKHAKVHVYYEAKDKLLPHGIVVKDTRIGGMF